MKSMILGLVAVAIGLGGGAFVSGSKVKEELLQAHADSLAAVEAMGGGHTEEVRHDDTGSTAEGGVHIDVTAADPAGHTPETTVDAGQAAEPPATPAQTLDETPPATGLPAGTTVDPASVPPAQPTPAGPTEAELAAEAQRQEEAAAAEAAAAMAEGAQKLSKIFGAMKAPDAAAVLEQMSDDEVKAILLQMSDRLAAAILGEFEPGRAAELTRVVLMSRGGGV